VREKLTILLLVVPLLAAICFLPRTAPQVVSTLRGKDVTEVTRAVRRERRRYILPDVSLSSIRQLPSSLRRYWFEQIISIDVQADGTVSVTTGRRTNGKWDFYGDTYELKLGPKGWVITGRGRTRRWPCRSCDGPVSPKSDIGLRVKVEGL
jgi:hypothetical protein